MRPFIASAVLCLLAGPAAAATPDQVIGLCKKIYREDATAKQGQECPCPDDINPHQKACGDRSAYVLRGGARPFCYSTDIPQEVLAKATFAKPSTRAVISAAKAGRRER